MDISANDRLGTKCRVACLPTDTIGEVKLLISQKIGTPASKIVLKKANQTYKNHIDLETYDIKNGFEFELSYK